MSTISPSSLTVPALLAALSVVVIVSASIDSLTTTPATPAIAAAPDTQAVLAATAPDSPGGIEPAAMVTLPDVVDAAVRRLMTELHTPGTAVAIVHDGRLIFLRGYGMSRVETDTPVDAGRTLFRIGSVTKPLTAAAVLQLVDEGALDLHRDVRQYIPRLSLPYGVTAHHLLTHTAGFDETFAGGFTRAPGDLRVLAVHVEERTAAARAPGQFYSYGNAHYSMAGRLLERLTGLSYEDAIDTRLFEPLKMTRTTARQPPEPALAGERAIGYEWDGSTYRALPFRYTQSRPAGAVSTTAADMSRFMLALLGDGSLDGVRVWSASSRAALLHMQFRDHPRLPGVTYAFHQWVTHGRMLLHHDGTLGDQLAVMLLDPANRFGLFVASNATAGIGNHLLEPVLTHLYGPAAPPGPRSPMPEARDADAVAGVYLDTYRTRHDLSSVRALMPMLQSRVRAVGPGTIEWGGRRWVEVAPFVFEAPNGDPLVFRHADGQPTGVMHPWKGTYERIRWHERTAVQLAFVVACLFVFAVSAVRLLWTWRRWSEGRTARACALAVALAHLVFTVWLVASLRTLGDTTPLPLGQWSLLALGVAAAAMSTLLPPFAFVAWREHWWSRGGRVSYSLLAASAVGFAAWLDSWKLLGFQY
jgi:CubicO group peptidase (beta-lactamase class C family)